jgi:lysophospholipase L1-like esterase
MARRTKKTAAKGREWLLLAGSVAFSLVIALALIRWYAPSLLGIRADMQVVRVSKELPPFYEAVFRNTAETEDGFILKDPYTRVRAKPLFPSMQAIGPHDLLGFRNRSIPNIVDILVIGDSQTYGNNTPLEQNWPSTMLTHWRHDAPVVYNVSTGGWAAVQYIEMLGYFAAFQPRVAVIAFYSGNDALESFMMAYSDNRYKGLRPDHLLSSSDVPPGRAFPPEPEDLWTASFKDGSKVTFSPKHRLSSNDTAYPAVRAGYEIMGDVIRRSVAFTQHRGISIVFTVIPTKELAYALRVQREGIRADKDYLRLVELEAANIARLSEMIRGIPNVEYVDLIAPLQQAALNRVHIYPQDADGHPLAAGYRVIANSVAPAVKRILPSLVRGLVALDAGDGRVRVMLARADGVWDFSSTHMIVANGWIMEKAKPVRQRDIETLPYRGAISAPDPARYGPAAMR